MANVLNRFQDPKKITDKNNKLILGGGMETPSGVDLKTSIISLQVDSTKPQNITRNTFFSQQTIITRISYLLEVDQGGGETFIITADIAGTPIPGVVFTYGPNEGSGGVVNFEPTTGNIAGPGEQLNFVITGAPATGSYAMVIVEFLRD